MASLIENPPLEMQMIKVAHKAHSTGQPQLVVFPNEALALRALTLLKTLLNGPQAPLPLYFPELKQSGLMRFESALKPNAGRIQALYQLTKHDFHLAPPPLLLCTLGSLLRVCPDSHWLSRSGFSLISGGALDPDEFVEKLYNDFGYTRTDVVEQVGEFSQRGSLLDVFSSAHNFPVRLDFSGDELSSLRLFRTGDQRSFQDIPSYNVLPIREFSWPSNEEMGQALEKFNAHLLKLKVQSKGRSDLLECLRARSSFPGVHDLWPCFVSYTPTTLWDTLHTISPIWGVSLIGPTLSLSHAFTELKNFYDQSFESAFGKAFASPRFEDLYPNHTSHYEKLASFTEAQDPVSKTPQLLEELGLSSRHKTMTQRIQLVLNAFTHPQVKNILLASLSADSLLETLEQWKNLELPLPNAWQKIEIQEKNIPWFQFHWLFDSSDLNNTPWCLGNIDSNFFIPYSKTLVISEQWLKGYAKENFDVFVKNEADSSQKDSSRHATFLLQNQFGEFTEGDPVVHVQYGVAKFVGLMTVSLQGTQADFLSLEYQGGDRIYVPIHKMNLVQKYVGAHQDNIPLDSLKASSWEKRKARAKEEALVLAKELIAHQAKRNTTPGHAFSSPGDDYLAFEAAFPYEETPDQHRSTREIMVDMGKPKPMDRLLCGDVGFGKTEVAMRAAYRCLLDGKQVAWLVPTTVLAHQHHRSLQERFSNFSINIELFDRSSSASAATKVLDKLKNGGIDILVGTHKLLSKNVSFRDLGLLIVDEEQRFGVLQKEKIKNMSYGIDVLTMTATPIPRTLQMAMLGLRDLSLLTTPPKARLAVKTFVCPFEPEIIEQAILAELKRKGQIFYVHNRVEELASVKEYLQSLIPSLRICVGHGKMLQKDLDKTIIEFLDQTYDLLLCSTIIESGIDMPNVNTIIVQNADRFGLAQLYQLRGRVGRRSSRGYAYFLTSQDLNGSSDGSKRLQILKDHQELGSGFIVASHDLEMRGAGSLLGDDQSGKSLDVGLETYTQMLDDAVKNLNGLKVRARVEPDIHVPFLYQVTSQYVENPKERLRIYRRFFGTQTEEALKNLVDECQDRFGPLPTETQHLAEVVRLRRWLVVIGAQSLSIGEEATEIRLPLEVLQSTQDQEGQLLFKRILDICNRQAQGMRITPDGRILLPIKKRDWSLKGLSFLDPIKKALAALAGE